MLTVLSPSKTTDPTPIKLHHKTIPFFTKETAQLTDLLKKMSAFDLMKLMSVSEKLAEQTYQKIKDLKKENDELSGKAAIMMFKGEVYTGLKAEQMDDDDLNFAQNHLRILSGLYGSLRPLDLIQEYRLEMGTRLNTNKGSNLYQFWGDKITKSIQIDLQSSGSDYLLNLASDEYFKSLKPKQLRSKIISVEFYDVKDGKKTFISFNAKKARGMMANFIVKNRINEPEAVHTFNIDGYTFDKNTSTDIQYTFIRY